MDARAGRGRATPLRRVPARSAGSRVARGRAAIDRIALAVAVLAVALLRLAGPPASGAAEPAFGILQFHLRHDLETSACLATGSCFLELEEEDDPAGWLAEIRGVSDLAVLHWDRAVPWLVFDADPPPGADRVAFFDARLDAPTVAWIDAFAAHFAAMPAGYLAVSLLDGERDRLSALHLGLASERRFTTRCPEFAPGTQVIVDPGTGPQSFDLARSYRNFVLYLARKLAPDHLALMVEANWVSQTCPARAAGLHALYRWLYDQVRAELGTGPRLFATLSLPPLLAYDEAACYAAAAFVPCGGAPPVPAQPVSVEACYPTDRSVIDALALGGRLDVLALSFYPDGLGMRSAPGEAPELRAYPLASWNAGGQCVAVRASGEPIDPLAAIDRLGWTGPIAIAETSARSCATPLRLDVPVAGGGTIPMVFEAPGSPASQAAWMSRIQQTARARDYLFFAHSFLRDYRPIGTWTVDLGILTPTLQSLFNTWPCSGLQDPSGAWKPEMLAIGLPEPARGALLAAGCALLPALVRRRDRAGPRENVAGDRQSLLQSDWRPPMRRAT